MRPPQRLKTGRRAPQCPSYPNLTTQRGPGHCASGDRVETPALCLGTPRVHMTTGKRGLKRGLAGRKRTVLLMLDETIITETLPLSSCYGPLGQPVRIPSTGQSGQARAPWRPPCVCGSAGVVDHGPLGSRHASILPHDGALVLILRKSF